ncbi:MAG TPA: sigma-54-dependent Fis family transcriptional regulator, partial [Polyangiaceae bacterium]|nr:sigma-54-dependent Fis family transcriptional regulator [Polyangiaceae bacterium]
MQDAELAMETDEETGTTRCGREPLVVPHLFLVLECGRPWAGGARHDLAGIDQILIGRGPKRSVSRSLASGLRVLELHVPDRHMSQKHARISRTDRGFAFEDLGSTNGSHVGTNAVLSPVLLGDGDVLEIGRTFFRFRAALATPPDGPADLDSSLHGRAAPQGFATLLPALANKHRALAKVAASGVPVLLLGETGTGKEVVARAIHQASGRKGPFVAVNCGAIPATLVEALLFGHTRGAFSGATRDELGFVRSAHQGTLFLDEIGDLPRAAQATLLRVLQEGEVVPVGTARPERVDLRVLSATHGDLVDNVSLGIFRADLFARLAG